MKTTLINFCVGTVLFGSIISANIVQKPPYTPYEILVLELKANEGYSPTWYKDGHFKGRQSYSIGFGWNDCGRTRRHEIKEYLKDGKISYDEATQITIKEIKKYGRLHKDPYKNLALQLYSYNCGRTTDAGRLGRCCGASKGCGNKNSDIRKSHGRRRKMELALWNKNMHYVYDRTDENKKKVQTILRKL